MSKRKYQWLPNKWEKLNASFYVTGEREGRTIFIIRLTVISNDFPDMNILVISDEQKAAVRVLWHLA